MKLKEIDIKSLIIGIIISVVCIVIGHMFFDWAYPFAAAGLLYVGYKSENIKSGVILGAVSAIPIMVFALYGYLGEFTGFFSTTLGMIALAAIVLIVGAFVGFIGAWAKKDRLKARKEYEKKQKIGKNKKKNKKKNNN